MPSSSRAAVASIFAGLALLTGCEARDSHQVQFYTSTNVALRASESEDSATVAMLPPGMSVVPLGRTGGHCMCWRVETPRGTGWVEESLISIRLNDTRP